MEDVDVSRKFGPRLPEIILSESNSNSHRASNRSRTYNSSSSTSPQAIPLSIRGSREPNPPPPLPPPKYLGDIASGGNNGPDLAWRFANSRDGPGSVVSSVLPGSSLSRGGSDYSSDSHSALGARPDYSRCTSSSGTIKSNGVGEKNRNSPKHDRHYTGHSASSSESSRSNYPESFSPPKVFHSKAHNGFQTSAQAYDLSMLQKLRTNVKTPAFSSSAGDASPTGGPADYRHTSQLKPLSLPILNGRPSTGFVESPVALSRYSDLPPLSAISPRNPYPRFGQPAQNEQRSLSDVDSDRSPHPYIRGSGSSSAMSFGGDGSSMTSRSRDSHDVRTSPDHDADFPMEEAGLRRSYPEEYSRVDSYIISGQKRRASSPPVDDGHSLHTVGSANDLYRRRESALRCPPNSHLHSNMGSVSSTGSGPRGNSYASSGLSIATSSISSMSSYGRSPGGLSPGGLDASDSPYLTSLSLNPSPRGPVSRGIHQRNLSAETRPLMSSSKLADSSSTGKSRGNQKIQGVYMCECCPKKPKKFDSQDELDAHQQEKQYQCQWCTNRFKNKNEMERHQNSLHLRRYSWSCAALSGYHAAFHESSTRLNEADSCGYCGEDFQRTGISPPSVLGPPMPIATDRDWERRIAHLQEIHKFGECNHAKKFFRADHFRQHLKHSHAGTSGKWTNMLENACMSEEAIPVIINQQERE